jgi:tripartite-type tricarboxylate transporter receptor subunit TctC
MAGFAIALDGATVAAADFYQGKQVRIVVGSDAGGGYDVYARLLARHWGEVIPGKPSFIVQNMPGASSLKAMNYLLNSAARDGTVLAALQNHVGYEPMFNAVGGDNVQFDPLALNWIGSAAREVAIAVVWHTSPIYTIKDAMVQDVVTGAIGVGTSTNICPIVMNATAGTRFNVIRGYKSQTEVNLAMERGEVQGAVGWLYSSFISTRGQLLAEKKVRIIAQIALEKHPEMPDVPLVLEFAKTPDDRRQMELVFGRMLMGRPYVAPPDVPADRIEILRDTFLSALASAPLLEEVSKSKLEIEPMSGAAIHKMLAEQYQTPKPLIDKVRAILAPAKN